MNTDRQVDRGNRDNLFSIEAAGSWRQQQLEAELGLERFYNQLNWKLQEILGTYSNLKQTALEAQELSLEAEIYQAVIEQVRSTLNATAVAIVLPDTGATVSSLSPLAETEVRTQKIPRERFSICYLAVRSSCAIEESPVIFNLGKRIVPLALGTRVDRAELEQAQVCSRSSKKARSRQGLRKLLSQSFWQGIWPIESAIGNTAYLMLLVPEQDLPEFLKSGSPFKLELIQRVIQICQTALCQARLIQNYQKLEVQNRYLVRTNQLKNEFLANTSHEIRTPLTSILGFTHLLKEQGFNPGSDRHQEYLSIVLSSGQHLLSLINDILDLSKIEADQLDLQWESVNILELCQLILTLVKERAARKGLRLCLDIPADLQPLRADPLRVKQMLFNLLSNALKFTPQGTVGLKVSQVEGFVHFTVWDTGLGIAPEQQKLLFLPYVQIANPEVDRSEGTGLGLSVTQKLAELHGGWIELESEVNQGSRFTIVLPRSPENLTAQKAPSGVLPLPQSQRLNSAQSRSTALIQ